MDNDQQMSKKEQIRLKHELERARIEAQQRNKKLMKWGIIVFIVVLVVAGFWWAYKESTKPLPGQEVKDLGRGHVPETTTVKYNSNPPTSGKHYEVWTKAGVYGKSTADGHLVHSLEHGYVIVSYNCAKTFSIYHFPFAIDSAYAHETDEPHEEPATPSAALTGKEWNSEACKTLKKQLADVVNEQKLRKLIVIPRENLDVPIALTAWARIEKLEKFDKAKIVAFIQAFRDKGPEQTME